jgi:hypothetical protein
MLHLQQCPLTLSEVRFPNMTTGRLPSIEGGIQPTIVDAKGDLIAATAADTPARLAVGANDTVLTADSAEATGLKWATPAAGGMTLIETLTLSGASVTSSAISGSYQDLRIISRNYKPATDGAALLIRMNSDTGSNYSSTAVGAQIYGTNPIVETSWSWNLQQDNTVSSAEAEAKAAQRQAILDRLGLTADEAQLLLGGN